MKNPHLIAREHNKRLIYWTPTGWTDARFAARRYRRPDAVKIARQMTAAGIKGVNLTR